MENASARRIATLAALGLGSLTCCLLVGIRIAHTQTPNFSYLIWNLVLAWIPFVLAILFYDAHRRGARPAALLGLGGLWLLFFPNAPYILTDFIHLGRDPLSPVWYDGLTISAFAGMGLLLGLGSLYLVQSAVRQLLGERLAWTLAGGALVLASIGIYLGRFVRLNSWDLFTQPHYLATLAGSRIGDPFGNAKLVAVTFLFTTFLAAAYLVVYTFATAGLRLDLD